MTYYYRQTKILLTLKSHNLTYITYIIYVYSFHKWFTFTYTSYAFYQTTLKTSEQWVSYNVSNRQYEFCVGPSPVCKL